MIRALKVWIIIGIRKEHNGEFDLFLSCLNRTYEPLIESLPEWLKWVEVGRTGYKQTQLEHHSV